MNDQLEHLEDLLELVRDLDHRIDGYLDLYPSARVSHARPTYLASALRREQEVVSRKAERKEDPQSTTESLNREMRMEYTSHEIEMSAMRQKRNALDPTKYIGGHTPAEYRAMVEALQSRPAQTDDEIAKVMRSAK